MVKAESILSDGLGPGHSPVTVGLRRHEYMVMCTVRDMYESVF